mmetsp:Transcript_26826/g.63644  ORF Transcript_26826/g.63644 Transcript_26826/m.63644 type:complete len:133 (+) Transcript_26826:646-1044(+)
MESIVSSRISCGSMGFSSMRKLIPPTRSGRMDTMPKTCVGFMLSSKLPLKYAEINLERNSETALLLAIIHNIPQYTPSNRCRPPAERLQPACDRRISAICGCIPRLLDNYAVRNNICKCHRSRRKKERNNGA